jgi:cytoskeletal protein CcmA (bactofilin family)
LTCDFSCKTKVGVLCSHDLIQGPQEMGKKDKFNALLGEGTKFEGKLFFEGTARIDGRFNGEIFTEGTLIVGEKAVLESDVRASHIVISGTIHGTLVAEKRIEIHAPGKVIGNIQAPDVSIAEGVIFEGLCQMQPSKEGTQKEGTSAPKQEPSENKHKDSKKL